jgi:gliding motility-associated-like protein
VLLSTPSQSGAFYQWFFNGLPIAGADQAVQVADSSGAYLVTVVDASGNCALSPALNLVLSKPPAYVVTPTQIDCFGEQNGALEVAFTGSGAGLGLQWTNDQGTVVSTVALADGLAAGSYTLILTDSLGCSDTSSYNLAAPAELLLTLTVEDATCLDNGLGTLTLTASGGTAPYSFSADGTSFTQEPVFNVPPGTYQPLVEDASGCETFQSNVVVGEETPLQIELSGPTDSVPAGEPFNLSVTANKPLSTVTLQWLPEALVDCQTCPEVVAAILQNTTFVVLATDAGGCTATAQLTVVADKKTFVYAPNVFAPETSGLDAVFNLFTGQGVQRLAVLRIYDRWGGLVFEGIEGWDGRVGNKTAMPGVYVWFAEVEYVDGTLGKLEGHVTLIR